MTEEGALSFARLLGRVVNDVPEPGSLVGDRIPGSTLATSIALGHASRRSVMLLHRQAYSELCHYWVTSGEAIGRLQFLSGTMCHS